MPPKQHIVYLLLFSMIFFRYSKIFYTSTTIGGMNLKCIGSHKLFNVLVLHTNQHVENHF